MAHIQMGADASKPAGPESMARKSSKEDIQALQAVGAFTDPVVPVYDYVSEQVWIDVSMLHRSQCD